MRKLYLTSIFTQLVIVLLSQYGEVYGKTPKFIPMDENFTLAQKFHTTDTILVIYPNEDTISLIDKLNIESYVFWGKKPIYIYKSENVIDKNDLKMHIQLFGAFYKFTTNDFLKIPIHQTKKGFTFKDKIFKNKADGFFYINDNATRFYTCNNSNHALNEFVIYSLGSYSFYIFRENEIAYSGLISDVTGKEEINDLQKARKVYFTMKSFKYFDMYIASTLNYDSISINASEEINGYIKRLNENLKSNTKCFKKIKLYIFANRFDLQNFISAPLWSTVWGKSIGNVICVSSYNMNTIRHEAAHSVIFQIVGNNFNSFLDEGFRQYTDYYFNKNNLKTDFTITKENMNLLTNDLVKGKAILFFSNPYHYNISGIFVKYLIDKIGLVAFKEAYSKNKVEEYLMEKYNCTIKQLIVEFKLAYNN